MTIDTLHRSAPEIIIEHAAPRCLTDHISVFHYRRYVIVHEVAVERIKIAADRDKRNRCIYTPSGRLGLITSAASVSFDRLAEIRRTVVPSPHVIYALLDVSHTK